MQKLFLKFDFSLEIHCLKNWNFSPQFFSKPVGANFLLPFIIKFIPYSFHTLKYWLPSKIFLWKHRVLKPQNYPLKQKIKNKLEKWSIRKCMKPAGIDAKIKVDKKNIKWVNLKMQDKSMQKSKISINCAKNASKEFDLISCARKTASMWDFYWMWQCVKTNKYPQNCAYSNGRFFSQNRKVFVSQLYNRKLSVWFLQTKFSVL